MCVLFTVSLVLLFSIDVKSQGIHFSQFSQAPLSVNPGATGMYRGTQRFIINHKSQWVSMSKLYQTSAISFDMPIMEGKGRHGYLGVGVNVLRDKAGDSKLGTTQASISVSGIVPFDDYNKLSLGIQGGAAQSSAVMDDLQWGSQYNGSYDPTLPHNEINTLNSFAFADFAAGVFYEFINADPSLKGEEIIKLNVGASCYHVNKPAQKFFWSVDERIYRKWIFLADARIDIPGSEFAIVPSAIFAKQGPSNETVFGAMARYRLKYGTKYTGEYSEYALSVGCHYRLKDAIIPEILFEAGDFVIGVSYDINASSFSQATKAQGGIEVSLKFINLSDATSKRRR